jgi:predicted dinucleotide-binding enzyme
MAATSKSLILSFIGGTGRMGSALAIAHASAGNKVIIGSRDEERAKEHAASLRKKLPSNASSAGPIEGLQNKDACDKADVVFLVFGDYQGVTGVSLSCIRL